MKSNAELPITDQIIALLDGYTIRAARDVLKQADDLLITAQIVKRPDAKPMQKIRSVRPTSPGS